jgi:hypothetical protein
VVSASNKQLGFEHFKLYVMYESSGTGAFVENAQEKEWQIRTFPHFRLERVTIKQLIA